MKKGKRTRRNVTLAVVVVCLCAAVYLNHEYNKRCDSNLNATSVSEPTEVNKKNNDELKQQVSDYFAEARLTRQQSRDEAIRLLESASSSETASKETIDSAVSAISVMANYSMQESQIENLLLAKEFEECVAFISSDGVTIAVPAPEDGLSEEEVAKITDAVIAESDFDATQIKVIPVTGNESAESIDVINDEPQVENEADASEEETVQTEAVIDEKSENLNFE